MTTLNDLRKIRKALKGAFTCPMCGKSQLVAATATGKAVLPVPTGHERIDPNKHCTCPGGPVDQAYGGFVIEGRPPREVLVNGRLLRPTKRAKEHSPDGFAWGYGGSGPAALAHSILAACVGGELADEYYDDFKWSVIAKLEQGKPWGMSVRRVQDWMSVKLHGDDQHND